jgi:hypothetical protein
MQLKNWLHSDKYSLGIVLGLVIPLPVYFVSIALLSLIQTYLYTFEKVRQTDLLLLGIAVNLIVMRHYIVKLKFEKTGKALLILNVILILLFFIFLQNSNFTFHFY